MGKVTWTPLHDRYLRRYYPNTDTNYIAEKLGRPAPTINSRAQTKGVKKVPGFKPKIHKDKPKIVKELEVLPMPERDFNLNDMLSQRVKNLDKRSFVFERKTFVVKGVSAVYGNYIIYTDLRTFVKDVEQIKRFLNAITIRPAEGLEMLIDVNMGGVMVINN